MKLADFGTSKYFSKKMHNIKGTPYYIAPEILNGNYDEKCDVWSLGVIFYVLLCGYPPFNGSTNEEILESVAKGKFTFEYESFENVSKQAKDLIQKMLTKNFNKRISAEEAL